jgi:uncharacterized membrane protein
LRGFYLFIFPLNYGSEPLYSYTVAGMMRLLGQTLFALRFVNVLFSVATIGITFWWVRRRFDTTTAWVTAVLLTVSFWPLASAREALRAGMLPFFMGTAVTFFWRLLDHVEAQKSQANRRRWWLAAAFGVCVALTLHIYLAARVAWLIFPLFHDLPGLAAARHLPSQLAAGAAGAAAGGACSSRRCLSTWNATRTP